MIYHIADQVGWENSIVTGMYEHPSLASEGFIHACLQGQIASVRKRYYADKDSLLLLHIDETLVLASIKHELAASVNDIFPHIYGKLNTNAVIKTEII